MCVVRRGRLELCAPCWRNFVHSAHLMADMLSDEELERLKAEGNTLYQQSRYEEAIQKYDLALGGPEGDGNGMRMGISSALLLNRAACRLVLADRAPPGTGVGGETEPGSKLDVLRRCGRCAVRSEGPADVRQPSACQGPLPLRARPAGDVCGEGGVAGPSSAAVPRGGQAERRGACRWAAPHRQPAATG